MYKESCNKVMLRRYPERVGNRCYRGGWWAGGGWGAFAPCNPAAETAGRPGERHERGRTEATGRRAEDHRQAPRRSRLGVSHR